MNDISIYFEPIDTPQSNEGEIGSSILINDGNFPDIMENSVAIFYVPEHRGVGIKNKEIKKINFRHFFYKLKHHHSKINMYDLGNILPGKTINDTYIAVSNVVEELIKNNVIPLIIGGGQDLSFAQYQAYEKLEQTINITAIDPKFDLGKVDEDISTDGYLAKIITHKPCYLFNYSNIGYQSYLINKKDKEKLKQMYFDLHRLGEINSNIDKVEPILRNTDLLSFDLTSIRNSDFKYNYHQLPNGFYGEQACTIARYAGISDKLTSVGFYNYLPQNDRCEITAHLLAQIVWYFIEGVNYRKGDFPIASKKTYTKYHVVSKKFIDEIIFYKSEKSGRWWMEVPYPNSKNSKYNRHHLVPCNYSDYEIAMNEEVPDLWIETFQKLV